MLNDYTLLLIKSAWLSGVFKKCFIDKKTKKNWVIRYFCVLLVCKGIICILSFLKVHFVFETNKVCHCNMLCLVIERTKGIVWEYYAQSAVCMARLLYCTLVYKFMHYKQSSAPLEHTHRLLCIYVE